MTFKKFKETVKDFYGIDSFDGWEFEERGTREYVAGDINGNFCSWERDKPEERAWYIKSVNYQGIYEIGFGSTLVFASIEAENSRS